MSLTVDETAGDLPVRDVGLMRGGLMPTVPGKKDGVGKIEMGGGGGRSVRGQDNKRMQKKLVTEQNSAFTFYIHVVSNVSIRK